MYIKSVAYWLLYIRFLKAALFLLPVLLLSIHLNAQEVPSRIASGIVERSFYSKDTSKVLALLKKYDYFIHQFPDSALIYTSQAYYLSRSIGYNYGIGLSLLYMGSCYFSKKNYTKTKSLLFEALPYCLSNTVKNEKALPNLYLNLGASYMLLASYDSAIYFTYKALEVIKNSNPALMLPVYINLGGILQRSGESAQALHYLRKALPLALSLRDTNQLGICYKSIAFSFEIDNVDDSALAYYQKALTWIRYAQNSQRTQDAYYSIGRFWLFKDSIDRSSIYFDSALAADLKNAATNSALQQGLASICYLKKDYKNAITYYKKALKISTLQGILYDKLTIYNTLAAIYHETGNHTLAYENQKAYSDLRDSLLDEQKSKTIHDLEVKYRLSEKDKELVQQKFLLSQKESRIREKNLWIGGITLTSLFLGTLLASYYRNNRHKQRLQEEQIRNMEQQQEIEHLNYRMQGEEEERHRIARELHDGVTVLLSAAKMSYTALGKEEQGLEYKASYQEVMQLLNEAGQEIRSVSYNLLPEVLIGKSLPAAVQAFCELVQRRHQLQITVQAFGTCNVTESTFVSALYRIVQELVHNIVKHARATEVLVQLLFHDTYLHLNIEDDGIGFERAKTGAGMGLLNIESRVKELQGQLTLTSIPGTGTTIEIEIPLTGSIYPQPEP